RCYQIRCRWKDRRQDAYPSIGFCVCRHGHVAALVNGVPSVMTFGPLPSRMSLRAVIHAVSPPDRPGRFNVPGPPGGSVPLFFWTRISSPLAGSHCPWIWFLALAVWLG